MADELPAYSGQTVDCPKCGPAVATTTFHHGTMIGKKNPHGDGWVCGRMWRTLPHGGHLCRLCKNCGYGWVEACIDSGDDQGSEQCKTTT